MQFTHEQLISIVEKASTLSERLSSKFIVNNELNNLDDLVNIKLEKWREAVANGDNQKFENRLAWDGLTLEDARRAVAPVSLVDRVNLPAWIKTLNEGVKASDVAFLQEVEYLCIDSEEPVPFEELFLPFIYIARQKLATRIGNNYQQLSNTAHGLLERRLLISLSEIAAHAVELKFSSFRATKQSALFYILRQSDNNVKRDRYTEFIQQMLNQDGLITFFLEYPVIARLLAITIDFWVDAIGEFLSHLAADYAEIQQLFQPDANLGQVVEVKSNLSDPHNNHHTVIILTFASGLKLVYKPKGLHIDEAYFNFLSWFNQQEVDLTFKCLKMLNRPHHGWVEFVEYSPCEDETEVKRFYQRTGILLGLLYILHGNDCHVENLIACGEHPVVIDLETVMHPTLKEEEDSHKSPNALELAFRFIVQNSVLQTHLLPQWHVAMGGKLVCDFSPLVANDQESSQYDTPIFLDINTDKMRLKYEAISTDLGGNHLPALGETKISPDNYVEDLIIGFQKVYIFLLNYREFLLSDNSPLLNFSHQRIRLLFRGTQAYASILNNAQRTEYLKDGVDRNIKLELLGRAYVNEKNKPLFWPLLTQELQSMLQMDIPYFSAFTDGEAVFPGLSSVSVIDCLMSTFPRAVARIKALDETDLNRQIEVIRGAFNSSIIKPFADTLAASVEKTQSTAVNLTNLTQEESLQQAIAIANKIQSQAFHTENDAAWIGLEYIPKFQRFHLQALDYHLNDGSCGIALFLAALWLVTKDEQYRQFALKGLQPLRQHLSDYSADNSTKLTENGDIGICTGLGSLIYGLVQISNLLNEPNLLDDAQIVASLITSEVISKDQDLNISSGSAGALLALLALYKVTGKQRYLEQAISCGNYLLQQGITGDLGITAWNTAEKKLSPGFAYGAAGIAYALLRLYDITLDGSFLLGAKEAIAYERSLLLAETNNQNHSFPLGWSHGTAGIVLARLGSLTILDHEEIRQEIISGLNTIQNSNLNLVDRLSCGNFGIIDVFLEAATKLSHPNLLADAQKLAASIVNKTHETGHFYLFSPHHQDIYNPGFFNGMAGIGYELLRLSYPKLLPAILLFD
ncbi:type 2 lantipeptide synthetase LanM [Calothrix sp. FACHB-1219]|uniref:type 2 lanthipeptide synthetase LanM family protein n=1 Tax=unclassified Calothrix TaxID=2619626 RepID=UPI0016847A63|nr:MULTISPECIES: type 2 lanthipeptide synthetase LanM family protein [unclassified Calothrix]MBD2207954.1 type 2 lantipeptide synthetase LanM [Calothrix sp. FACHB-168]MBD2222506.1 type 2 lantipeptide synthetase LanM [Calothrix sp. FACHB-1219]